VLPIVRLHCQSCHRPGEIGPMPLVTYDDARLWAEQIRKTTTSRTMPPWFADPCCGKFDDDPSLTPQEISTLSSWVETGTAAGKPGDAPPATRWAEGWNIPSPDAVVRMPQAVRIPDHGDVEYTYEIVPTNFAEDRWVQMSEVRPTSREHVHHAVVYIRP